MTERELAAWADRLGGALAGFVAGVTLGLGWSYGITRRLIDLGSRMGTMVAQALRLSQHVSREYQAAKQREEVQGARISTLEVEVFGEARPAAPKEVDVDPKGALERLRKGSGDAA